MIWMAEKGRISLDIEKIFDRLENATNFAIVPLDMDITKRVSKIKLRELHDRIIVATALTFNSALITKDREIIESGIVKTIW